MPTDRSDSSRGRPSGGFVERHIGPRPEEISGMLKVLGLATLHDLERQVVPADLGMSRGLNLEPARTESEIAAELTDLASRNKVFRSFIGMGYAECVTPAVIRKSILENPGWYTAYTPYQPEISQGRLEALLNFQTMVADLTGFSVANASLLDEGTAAAEAMTLCLRAQRRRGREGVLFISSQCHPQTIGVVKTRARWAGIEVMEGDHQQFSPQERFFAALLQYPGTDGRLDDLEPFCRQAREAGIMTIVATDLLALTLLRPPGEFGADVAVGSSQRFGVPLGYGGPHAAFLATGSQYQRSLPGRLVGVSRDAQGQAALRLALQTREQHIRRDKATSNICTAQVLLAVMASMYAVYHGPQGLRRMARRIRCRTMMLAGLLQKLGCKTGSGLRFDTLRVQPGRRKSEAVAKAALEARLNLRKYEDGQFGISLAETTTLDDLVRLQQVFGGREGEVTLEDLRRMETEPVEDLPLPHRRQSDYLTHPVFHSYRSETEFMRYLYRLERRDLSLTTSMIPLGSCTMKLNAAAEMLPITEPGFAAMHPFAPPDQAEGYHLLFRKFGSWLAEITGFPAVSFMPNAGAQGEYTGLLTIRAYQASRGEAGRNVCLIPSSAHGTNPASAAMSGMQVVVVACDADGNIDLGDLKTKAQSHGDRLAALMVTYPSTHGVFETGIRDICQVVHDAGGQVYLDGANMNALVGLCRPAELGADLCHLNLHKTFCIPHGGGGPGMGPICAAAHLAPFLPRHPLLQVGGEEGIGPVSSAPFGSPGILPISYAYIAMMGGAGLKRASLVAILNANYIARRLEGHFNLLYRGQKGLVAHECILDMRPFEKSAGVTVDDIAKRLMDHGFHAPTMSWPVAGTLMVEPTESESRQELDRFIEALISIREEIRQIENGEYDRTDNPLKGAPHTLKAVTADRWEHPYSRQTAAFPSPWLTRGKFWPSVARVDNVYGDRHPVLTCPPQDASAGCRES
ncbi:MAG: aminomethyl-transferring glycine dehydrogenase [Acidobacteriota bacterium]